MKTKKELRVDDALLDILGAIANEGTHLTINQGNAVRVTLELLAQRLLTDAAMVVNQNYPIIRHASHGGQYTTPSRVQLANMIQDL